MKNRENNRKFLEDRNFPPKEHIDQYRNFDQLIKKHAVMKTNLFKKYLNFSGGIAGVAVVAALVYLSTKSPDNSVAVQLTDEGQPEYENPTFIQPPLKDNEIEFSVYQIDAGKGGKITHESGTVITIPPDVFLNEKGETVSEVVSVYYREFMNPSDIFLSGIPMTYDSAGTKYIFESAGMMEIKAFFKDMPLSINENKTVSVEMLSEYSDTRYNLYFLDTIARNWVHLGKDFVSEDKTKYFTQSNSQTGYSSFSDDEFEHVKPCIERPDRYSFKISYDKKDFPELSIYEDVLFEVVDNNFSSSYYNVDWEKITLSTGTEKGQFVVNLHKADTTIAINAIPVFEKGNYEKAMAEFEKKHAVIQKETSKNQKIQEDKLREINKNLKPAVRVTRTFGINQTGVYNLDYPIPPPPAILAAKVKFRINSDELSYETIYLVEKGVNSVFKFSKDQLVIFKPDEKYLMWTITDQNEFAFCPSSNFKKLISGNKIDVSPEMVADKDKALIKIKKFTG